MSTNNLVCLHCGCDMPPFIKPRLYCSIGCEQEAELVRYARRCIDDGRINQSDVQLAIHTRLSHIMAGGYDKQARKLSTEIRKAVLNRSKGKCEICGKEGCDIDHIQGVSSDLTNLQFLCKDCHNKKTQSNIYPVEPGTAEFEYVTSRAEQFMRFVKAESPLRVCHDEIHWNSMWRQYQNERKSFSFSV